MKLNKKEKEIAKILKDIHKQNERFIMDTSKEEILKCLDRAIMRCNALILSAEPPVITETYLLQDLLTVKSLLEMYRSY